MLGFFVRLISRLPFGVLYAFSDCIYFTLYYVGRYRRRIARRNLTESFPEKSEKEIVTLEKKFYRFFADNLMETIKLATISAAELSRRMRFTNIDQVNAEVLKGRSVSLFLGHFGNWEWISSIPLHLPPDVTGIQIYHTLSNKHVNALMLKIRERMGAHCVEMRHTARCITSMAYEHRECMVGFIADHSPRRKFATDFIPFLHHCVPVLTGPEKLTKRYGYEAWFVDVRRVKRGFYQAEFVPISLNPQSMPDHELTRAYFGLLEQAIRRQPELYLWTHNRFKYAKPLTTNPTN